MHEFAEEGRRNFFDIIAITYQKGAKSSLYRVPAVPTDFIIVISAIPLFRASIYRATYCTIIAMFSRDKKSSLDHLSCFVTAVSTCPVVLYYCIYSGFCLYCL